MRKTCLINDPAMLISIFTIRPSPLREKATDKWSLSHWWLINVVNISVSFAQSSVVHENDPRDLAMKLDVHGSVREWPARLRNEVGCSRQCTRMTRETALWSWFSQQCSRMARETALWSWIFTALHENDTREPHSGESPTTECGFIYQLLAVIFWSSPMRRS